MLTLMASPQGTAFFVWNFQVAEIEPNSSGTRLVALAVMGSSPIAIRTGNDTADPDEGKDADDDCGGGVRTRDRTECRRVMARRRSATVVREVDGRRDRSATPDVLLAGHHEIARGRGGEIGGAEFVGAWR